MQDDFNQVVQVFTAFIVISIVRCYYIYRSKKNILEEIDSRVEEGMITGDVFLKVTSKVAGKHRTAFTAEGLFRGKRVGLIFDVANAIEPLFLDGNPATPNKNSQGGFIKDGVILRSLGVKSDNFIVALSTLYGMSTTKKFTNHEVKTTATSFARTVANFDVPGVYHFKLFSQEDEESPCEFYCNINTVDEIIEFHEKDELYRSRVLKLLTT